MIFDLIQSPHSTKNTILIPTNNSPMDAEEIYEMLNDSFPYRYETHQLDLWCFGVICWGGYCNAIEFQN